MLSRLASTLPAVPGLLAIASLATLPAAGAAQLAVTDGTTVNVVGGGYDATAGGPQNAAIYAANPGSTIVANGVSVTTAIAGVPAVYAAAGGSVVLTNQIGPTVIALNAPATDVFWAAQGGRITLDSVPLSAGTASPLRWFRAEGAGSVVTLRSVSAFLDGGTAALARDGGAMVLRSSSFFYSGGGGGRLFEVVGEGSEVRLVSSSVLTPSSGRGALVTGGGLLRAQNSFVQSAGDGGIAAEVRGTGSRVIAAGSEFTSTGAQTPTLLVRAGARGIFSGSGLSGSGGNATTLVVTGPGSRVDLTGTVVSATGASSTTVALSRRGQLVASEGSIFANAESANGEVFRLASGARAAVSDATITSDGADGRGIVASGPGTSFIGRDLTFDTGSTAVRAESGARVVLRNATISEGSANPSIDASGAGTQVSLTNVDFTSTPRFTAVGVSEGATATLRASRVTAVGGEFSSGLLAQSGGRILASDSSVRSIGGAAVELRGGGSLTGERLRLTGDEGIRFTSLGSEAGPNAVSLRGSQVLATSGNAFDIQRGAAAISVEGGSVTARRGDAFHVSGGSGVGQSTTAVNIRVAGGASILAPRANLLAVEGARAVTFTAERTSLVGTIRADSRSDTRVTLNRGSTLTGSIHGAGLAVDATSRWNVSASSQLTGLDVRGVVAFPSPTAGGYRTLRIAEGLRGRGTFLVNTDLAAGRSDELVIAGRSEGKHTVVVANAGGTPDDPDGVRVVTAPAGGAEFRLGNPGGRIDAGLLSYRLAEDDAGNWSLTARPDGGAPSLSPTGKAVVATATVPVLFWQASFSTVQSRMGELRLSFVPPLETTAAEGDGKATAKKAVAPPAASPGGDLWVRGHGRRLNATTGLTGDGFAAYLYGVDLGVDKAFRLDGSWLLAGAFAGWGGASTSFDDNVGSGVSQSVHGGLYATWLTDSGWYLDGVARLGYLDNQFDAETLLGEEDHAQYGTWGFGFSLEGGRRVELGHGWFVEPKLQVAYAHLAAADYSTREDVDVSLAATDLFFGRAELNVGKVFATPLGAIQPYAKVAFLQTLTNGGSVRATGYDERPNFDGPAVEAGAGVAMQVTQAVQLYGAYEFAAAERYTQPWSVNGGLRWTW